MLLGLLMKLPALWIAAAFVAGVALAAGDSLTPGVLLAMAAVAAVATVVLLRAEHLGAAWCASLGLWFALGGLAASIEQRSTPAHHVTRLIKSGRLETTDALRWRGRLRSDPVRLPWGLRYEVDLDEVELAGATLPITGGLRLSYFRDSKRPEAEAAVRAGDLLRTYV